MLVLLGQKRVGVNAGLLLKLCLRLDWVGNPDRLGLVVVAVADTLSKAQ